MGCRNACICGGRCSESCYEAERYCGEAMDMIKYLMNEFTDASIARVFGYSKERIRQIRKEIGLTKYKESE